MLAVAVPGVVDDLITRVLEAAHIKARYPMAYADAFAVATALAHGPRSLPAIRRSWTLIRAG